MISNHILLLGVCVFLGLWNPVLTKPQEPCPTNKPAYRLPTNVFPTNYELHMKTFLPGYGWKADERNATFEGFVKIEVNVTEATDRIVLHSDGLEIVYADIETDSVDIELNSKVKISKWELNSSLEFLILSLSEFLQPQSQATIFLGFKAKLRTDNDGYYLTPSIGTNGNSMLNAVTQFETTYARSMVPCFDEPEFKATWKVSLEHPKGSTALSNGIEEKTLNLEDDDQWEITTFKKTVKMSSYLLAIFVGDVRFKETQTDKGVRIRVYADPPNVDKIDHALNVSRIVLEGFEKQFGIDYPMEKLDFLCAHRFKPKAMESWGLIVHTSSSLLGKSIRVRETVIHEIAHQWFGNLVTMKFWDEIWLNEGFASYMTAHGMSYISQTADIDLLIAANDQRNGFKLDENVMTKPLIGLQRNKSGNIVIVWNVYHKGDAFIKMIEKIIGTKGFNAGIIHYLATFQYKNTNSQDLYDSLSQFQSPDVLGPNGQPFELAEFAKCWTSQLGHPIITSRLIGENTYVLTQRNDLHDYYNNKTECENKWDVPIWYQEVGNREVKLMWISRNAENLTIKSENRPVFINANSNGYYKTELDNNQYKYMLEALKNDSTVYSISTKYRMLMDMTDNIKNIDNRLFAEIVVTMYKEKSIAIRKTVEFAVHHLKAHLDEQIAAVQRDVKTLGEIVNEGDFNSVGSCRSAKQFVNCILTKQMDHVCLEIRYKKFPEFPMALTDFLKIKNSEPSRKAAINLLECTSSDTLKRIYKDEEYNWTVQEKEYIENLKPDLVRTQEERIIV